MKNLMNKIIRSSIIISIIFFILGLLLIFESETTIISISYIIGTVLISIGSLAIINFIRKIKNDIDSGLDIVYGIVTIILGILVITNPQAIASIIPFIIGVMIIVNSATKLQYSYDLKQTSDKAWKITMIISILTTICGVLLIFNPFKGALIVTKIVGLFILFYSTLDIISSITIRKNVKNPYKSVETTIIEAEVIEDDEIPKKKKGKKNKKKEI